MVIGNYKSPEKLYDEGLQKEKECKQDKAFYYFKEFTDLGLVPAIHKVRYCFLHGDDTDKNKDKALEYLQKFADINYANSIFQLAEFFNDMWSRRSPAYWRILDLTRESLFDCKEIDNELLNEVAQLFTNMIAWSPKSAPKNLQEYFNNKCEDVRYISKQELKMATVFALIHGIFSQNVIDDKWREVQFLATNEACNELNNPFQ
ncbi:19884_t:CDS:2 [Cetraspora pellucida]|uniref:19884_t:CDS:1 n=1 Tax=Cetraspora pellucida TaxID=1433469 RepID=A0A9N9F486_9GLOM|nr:19884_t:CDS:2 [Cetraspora pellucida]